MTDMQNLLVALVISGCTLGTMALGNEGTTSPPPRVFLMDGTALMHTKARLAAGDDLLQPAMEALRRDADKSLKAGPFSVMQKKLTPPSGDKHDYMSFGPYWWPDPSKPDGLPYIRKDGQVSPESREGTDRQAFGSMAGAVITLAQAYYFTGHEPYAERAALLLRTWFLDEATKMNPHLQYGQGVPGRAEGRCFGIIDAARLIELCDAVGLLAESQSWSKTDQEGMEKWFKDFLEWLRTSDLGKEESSTLNNHGVWYDAQAVSYALFSRQPEIAAEIAEATKIVRIQAQIMPDGRQPHELARTKPLGYCQYNVQAFFLLADLARHVGVDLWHFSTDDGRSIRRAMEWLTPYLTGASKLDKEEVSPLAVPNIGGMRLLLKAADVYDSRDFARAASSLPGMTAKIMAKDRSALLQPAVKDDESSETLYNGIKLPSVWPPRDGAYSPQPPNTPPYLVAPPEVIPIDVGRQLFVDDFLIEFTSLERSFHSAKYHPNNPVLAPDKPWESAYHPDYEHWRDSWSSPCAMPFSGGIWYDPSVNLFKMWYMGGLLSSLCYATSSNGISWQKPLLDVEAGTNKVYPHPGLESNTVWFDWDENNPAKRFKFFYITFEGIKDPGIAHNPKLLYSPDGIHWSVPIVGGECGDRSTAFYNPFRKVWVYSLRWYAEPASPYHIPGGPRVRHYLEHPDFFASQWQKEDTVYWTAADDLDVPRGLSKCQLYNLDCVAYESLMIGLFSILEGEQGGRPKINEVKVGFSRDGFHWDRPDRQVFIPVSDTPYDWNWGNVQSTSGCCFVVGDNLYFYVSGRQGEPGTKNSGVCSTGLAMLRRDGFASMEAGASEGTLTTRPVRFKGKHMFVNVQTAAGELKVEVLNRNNEAIAPFTKENCIPISVDKTLQAVTWSGAGDLSALSNQPVKLRFHLTNGKLYSFWVSPDASGASHGYVAAGGPGFTGPTDTVGENP